MTQPTLPLFPDGPPETPAIGVARSPRSEPSREATVTASLELKKGRGVRHGHRYTATYQTWCAMKARCQNPKNEHFAEYGGRGISICQRWRHFPNFLADMGERPAGTTIERNDVNGNYEPGNCRWATAKEQMSNTRRNVLITHAGRTQTAQQWAAELGINPFTIYKRIAAGWTGSDLLRQPSAQPRGKRAV